jgi:hypothetical protein
MNSPHLRKREQRRWQVKISCADRAVISLVFKARQAAHNELCKAWRNTENMRKDKRNVQVIFT